MIVFASDVFTRASYGSRLHVTWGSHGSRPHVTLSTFSPRLFPATFCQNVDQIFLEKATHSPTPGKKMALHATVSFCCKEAPHTT